MPSRKNGRPHKGSSPKRRPKKTTEATRAQAEAIERSNTEAIVDAVGDTSYAIEAALLPLAPEPVAKPMPKWIPHVTAWGIAALVVTVILLLRYLGVGNTPSCTP